MSTAIFSINAIIGHNGAQRQSILMCPPDYFAVDYVINAWMENNCGTINKSLATSQWQNFYNQISKVADVFLIQPQQGLPDMVFTANAGMVLGNKAIISRFLAQERQGEEKFFAEWFAQAGYELVDWPQDVFFEGAGDALFDRGSNIIWAGYGFRSDVSAHPLLEQHFSMKVVSLNLVNPRFYHLDTCLCPLEDGYVLYHPAAFSAESLALIHAHVPAEKRLVVEAEDAHGFACNAMEVARHVFMNQASPALQEQLRLAGFTAVVVPLTEFLKSGGGAKCLSLKLHETPLNAALSSAERKLA
ncbi:MAG: dimethylarginine dimethylaminohydrolase family protein [Alphaproteobacteria bacterium]